MKYSICDIQLLPKAADLRKRAFDEFRLENVGCSFFAPFTECSEILADCSAFLIPSFPGLYRMVSVSLA